MQTAGEVRPKPAVDYRQNLEMAHRLVPGLEGIPEDAAGGRTRENKATIRLTGIHRTSIHGTGTYPDGEQMLKAVIWDNDGVLVDTEELYFETTREVLSGVGVDLTREVFAQISLRQGRSVFGLAAAAGIDPAAIARLRVERNRRYSELLRNGVRVIDGVEDGLRRLQGKVLMGIVTSSLREHFEIIHSGSGLLPYFDFALTREDYKKTKPDPEPFLTALRRNGLKPRHGIIVEDSERGLAAAKAAGIRCIVVPNRLTAGGDFSGAFRVLDGVREAAEEVVKLLS
jgi:HAD superfamily hydrolase (TIGR01509 family)